METEANGKYFCVSGRDNLPISLSPGTSTLESELHFHLTQCNKPQTKKTEYLRQYRAAIKAGSRAYAARRKTETAWIKAVRERQTKGQKERITEGEAEEVQLSCSPASQRKATPTRQCNNFPIT
ncbi:hypothetical protein PoB_004581500 [Plakobranchus ocellatus]|uniref:Uncharacterized protein n=1 Tax=Plakobranchus ocellatus TaxID=259542 RepID=A0AAV4BIH8_9GAST|nr:hypothetical protein PoB_004581500 [Plakobranchus ocellatus]